MRTISTGMFMSLDGVIDADGDWQFPYFDEQFLAALMEGMGRFDTVVMGRVSYQGYARLRVEHPGSPMVAFLDGVDRHVVSRTLTEVDWPGTTVIGDDVTGGLRRLKESAGGDILVPGSPTLVRGLLRDGLLDHFDVTILPIVVGTGPRLFPEGDAPGGPKHTRLTLVSSTTLDSGALALRYVPAADHVVHTSVVVPG